MGGQPSTSFGPCPSVVPFVTPPEHAAKLWLEKSSANKLRCANAEVILLGDSRTEGWLHGCAFEGMICTKLSQSAAVAGSGGDRVQHILWRVQNGELDSAASTVKLIYLLVGINNLLNTDVPSDVAKAVLVLANDLCKRYPHAHVLIQLEWPPPNHPWLRKAVVDFNRAITEAHATANASSAANYSLLSIDPFGLDMWREDTTAADEAGGAWSVLLPDGIHPSKEGYAAWADSLVPELVRVLSER